jgi:hypothetical protein
MNDNLKQLLKEATEKSAPIAPPEFYTEKTEEKEEDSAEKIFEKAESLVVPSGEITVGVVPLNRWLPANISKFENIKMVTISVRDVPPDLDIVVAVPDIDAPERKRLKILSDANKQPILDLPGVGFMVYSSGMTMLLATPRNPKMFIKGYTLRNNFIAVCCFSHSGVLLPYYIHKVKKKDSSVELPVPDGAIEESIIKKLEEPLDKTAFSIRYKQSAKNDSLVKVKDAVEWILKRYAETTDVHHLIQIDSALLFTLIN